jgi:hypothetical protein
MLLWPSHSHEREFLRPFSLCRFGERDTQNSTEKGSDNLYFRANFSAMDEVLGIVLVFVVLPACICFLFLRRPIKKWRLAKQMKMLLREPIAIPYRINYTSTVQDLLDAHSADAKIKSGLGPFARFLFSLCGIFWALGPIWVYVFLKTKFTPANFILWLFGCTVVWGFLLRPWFERRRIGRNNPPEQDLVLEFSETGIMAHNSSVGEFHRSWSEVGNAVLCSKGLLLYFTDGICNLLPKRVFSQKKDMLKLHAFIHKHMLAEEIKSDEETEGERETL